VALGITFYAGNRVTGAQLQALVTQIDRLTPLTAFKTTDESVNNGGTGTTLQNDDVLFCAVTANTNYRVDFSLLYTEAAGTGIDLKCAWTMPTGSRLDLGVAGPSTAWTGAAAALEAEWSAWQNQTTSPTGTISFGTTNAAAFSMQASGSLRVGSTAGTFQFQWAQLNSSASNVTVKAGSVLTLTPL
jgi:hypothetical protein